MTEEKLNGKYIYIAIPTRGNIHVNLCQWLGDTIRKPYKGYQFTVAFRSQDPTDCNRNELVKSFLKDKRNEWLLFLDDDMAPYGNLLDMMQHGKKIVSGLTCVWQGDAPSPLVMRYANEEKTMYKIIPLEALSEEGRLIEVDGMGAACMLIHREVLEKMKPPWYKFKTTEEGCMEMSEDYCFCKKAQELGYKIYIDPEQVVGHMKWVDLMRVNQTLFLVKANKKINITDLSNYGIKKNIFGRTDMYD